MVDPGCCNARKSGQKNLGRHWLDGVKVSPASSCVYRSAGSKLGWKLRFTETDNTHWELRMSLRDDSVLLKHLADQGLSKAEIDEVLEQLEQHDKKTVHESVFDSIQEGTFDLQAIIESVRDENKPKKVE